MIGSNKSISRFDDKAEILYRSKFSNRRYKIFLFIEKLYKIFINSKDPRFKVIVNRIQNTKPVSILEIGSGTLPVYAFLPKFLKEKCQYHVCEVNFEKARLIAKKYKNINVCCSDALTLPYQNNFFDFIFSKGVLHHIDDEDSEKRRDKRFCFFVETRRVLKDGGTNLVMDFDYNPKRFKDFFWHLMHKTLLFEGEHNFSTKDEIENLFKGTGYKAIEAEEFETFKGLYYCVTAKK